MLIRDRTNNANQLQEIYRNLRNGEESTSESDHGSIAGRIVARRAFGKLAFFTLRDDSGIIQYRRYCSSTAIASSSQIAYYVRLGEIEAARKLFEQIPNKNIAAWNSIISGYFQNSQPVEAQRLFDEMPERNTVSWNGLISGYIKNGMLKKAREVFDIMPERNVISWTAMVRGYVEEGMVSEAEALFLRMPEKNVISWTVMLGGLIHGGRIDDARRLFDSMPVKDVVTRTTMIGGLCSRGQLDEAREIFDSMRQRNVVSWTTMISGYAQNGKVDVARKLFEVMPEKNEVTWSAMLMGYTQCGRIEDAWELFKAMPTKPVVACNAMIIGLGENGEVSKARNVFELMREKDDGTWSAMIKIYERKGFELEALSLFRLMHREGVRPHFPSLISILSVCASLATLDHGRQIHAQMLRSKFDDDMYLSSVLITMYMKCGDVVKAKIIFDRFSLKDVVMWNSVITGYAQHGLGDHALQVFREMSSSGVQADDITFVGVLSACSYSGKVKEGKQIFELMKSKNIEPTTEHYACMVDLLGRAGQLNEAMNLINEMPVEADAVVWGSLMGACRNHMNPELAEVAAKKLLQLEPNNAGPYVLLSNIYASKGRWGDVANLRKNMRSRKVSKSPGCSWIEVEKEVHMFTGGESKAHPDHMEIIKLWEKLGGMLREAGYNPDGAFALHDVDEEEKAQSLRHHSEKLAVAFGLLKLPEGVPIRGVELRLERPWRRDTMHDLVKETTGIDFNKHAGLTERFELVICGHEMGNAFSQFTDPLDQRERLEEQVRQHAKKKAGLKLLLSPFSRLGNSGRICRWTKAAACDDMVILWMATLSVSDGRGGNCSS
ncbi:Pentatricopeptide repeat-containing protein, mitochondrial [Sesamum angolense]|uniref:Pentatricopeptide repeat-containing protein, mitochondrial n=1 Tax=Sesamum angolense TaxID=2727404 RepID=A0AAE1XC70_9LAMI|nr:Pentatricopeptide repeat-containing protein, mitochondrial [Sesamum angolense]